MRNHRQLSLVGRTLMHLLLDVPDPISSLWRPGIAETPHLWPELCGCYRPRKGINTNARLWRFFGGEFEVYVSGTHLALRALAGGLRKGIRLSRADAADPLIFQGVLGKRLEGNTHNLWVAISVTTDGMSITSPQKWDRLSSPARVKGTGSAFEGDVGTVYVFDHLYKDIGHAKGAPATNGRTSFTASVGYKTTFPTGAQEGVLAFYRYSEADGGIAGVVMLKVLIGA